MEHGQRKTQRCSALQLQALVLCLLAGCSQPDEPPPAPADDPSAGEPLRVLIVDDPALAEAVQLQWRARAEGEIEVLQKSAEELVDPRRKRLAADVVIYPNGLIGELAERDWIVPIAKDVFNGPEFGRRDIFDQVHQREVVWGEQAYAVPLGSPQLTVMYDAERLQQRGLDPPKTWEEYAILCVLLGSDGAHSFAVPSRWVVVEPLGPGWAGQVLLARAAASARHRSYFATLFDLDTMEPLIDSPPFVQALKELVAAAKHGPAEAIEYSPADVRQLLLTGRCSIGLTWPSAASGQGVEAPPDDAPMVSLTAAGLPGSDRVYCQGDGQWQQREPEETGRVTLLGVAGRIGSVVKGARRPGEALGMLLRLSGPEWSPAISPQSPATTLYRISQIEQAAAWTGDGFEPDAATEYAELTRETYRCPLWVISVRIPGRKRYLDALDDTVHAAIRGEKSPEQCLEEAAQQWRAITEEIGLDKQKAAYWRSLCIEPN